MRVMSHNDEVIRQVSTFKRYNNVLTEIVSEDYREIKDKCLEKPLFCGTFIAKVFIGQKIIGTYKFDCTHYRNFAKLDRLTPRLTKLRPESPRTLVVG